MQFNDLDAQYEGLKKKIDQRIQTVLKHGQYIMGPEVVELEQRLALLVDRKHAISCANGTDALTLALMAMGIGRGDAVFCPTFTFFATAESIASVGATPIFVDVDKDTFNLCPASLVDAINAVHSEAKYTPKVVISVDLFGLPANYDEILACTKKHNLLLLEDAAQAFGGSIGDTKTCAFGDISTTSFFPAKPLGCYGDGGCIFTDNDEFAELIRSFRVHGKGADKYDNVRVGMNSRLDTIQAAILLEKLMVFGWELASKQILADKYHSSINNPMVQPFVPKNYVSAWAQYTLKIDNRNQLQKKLKNAGIPCAIYYVRCVHQQKAFASGKQYVALDRAEKLTDKVISLPMHAYLNDADASNIAEILQVNA